MHELSLCRSVYNIVDNARNGRQVSRVHLQVGMLRQVVPATLMFCWSIVCEGSELAGAELEIDHVPVTIRCRRCNQDTLIANELLLVCGACERADEIEVMSGEEMLVTSMDLQPDKSNSSQSQVRS